jgi:hypothetical protein
VRQSGESAYRHWITAEAVPELVGLIVAELDR